MNSKQTFLIIIGFILLSLMATNPSIDDHRQAVTEKMKEKISESSSINPNTTWEKAGESLGMALGNAIVEKSVSRDNYLFFSLTKMSFANNEKNIGIGIFGNVFINDYNEVENNIEDNNKQNENKLKETYKSFWIGKYNDYEPSLPSQGDDEGTTDIEIQNNGSELKAIYENKGMYMGGKMMGETYNYIFDFSSELIEKQNIEFISTESTNNKYRKMKIKIFYKNDKYYLEQDGVVKQIAKTF